MAERRIGIARRSASLPDPMFERLEQHARRLRAETHALSLAARHPGTPWYAKLLVAAIVAYALSPLDLIPDFIPVIGYLDDLVLIPLGIALTIRLVPPAVLVECRERARQAIASGKPASRAAAVVIVLLWLVLAALCMAWVFAWLGQAPAMRFA